MYDNFIIILSLVLVLGVFVGLGYLYHRINKNYRKREKDYKIKNPTVSKDNGDYSWKHVITSGRRQRLWIGLAIIGFILIMTLIAAFIPENLTWEDILLGAIVVLAVIWKIIKRLLPIGLIGFGIYGLISNPKEYLKYFVIGIAIAAIFYFFSNTTTIWTGFYYPNAMETTDNPIVQGGFKTKSDCFDRLNTQIKGNDYEDYECGTNCEYMADFDVYKCNETYDSR